MQKFLSNQNKLFLSLLIIIFQVFLSKPIEVLADLPTGNAVKDPSAILRNALPIKQVELQELQHKLEDTSDLVRGGRWPALTKTVTKCQSLLKKYQSRIIKDLPNDKQNIAGETFLELKEDLNSLLDHAKLKDKFSFVATRKEALDKIGGLEEYFLPNQFPYAIPDEFDNLPRLLGRAKVNIKTSKGDMKAIVDGFNAPLTAGAFIDLSTKNFYKDLPINRAEEFFVLQTGDPIGEAIGYLDPETNEERHVPLEIRIPNENDTFYNQTFEDLGMYTETPTLPFATLGTLGWSHSNTAVDDGSSQFFFFLYEAELNPAGRNLIDGRNAAFGYVVDGFDVLEQLSKDDTIISIDVLEGIENLKLNA
ncbi:peptidylprolyl isomerase [Prochlorococcus marinus str. MU1404]|uniref:peptidylprolyl isomerase n=1 Tax=Prochlorococcus marinus TaxID=1219 RepID=UPI001ADBA9CC|nr:peptidylprolyl isomerase [Prochlorococcus marinus]MBO8229190.1 peptidylprolyl isomerase [Prochlorococcus marinus XMU1404]MBW3072273.1 peptidylprolyl isomerase [Prochlorococcus marinus str. MU1404]MCR8544627.1 peptidylprolyl isomerase [Prochlorococcus marinus CUG1432]